MSLEANTRFGWAWLMFAVSLACHVMDEAAHDFLAIYNPNALWLRARFHLPFPPVFTFREWIISLSVAIILLLVFTPLALREKRWLQIVAIPIGLLVGIGNGLAHVLSSFYFHKLMPGVISAPLIIATGVLLLAAANPKKKGSALGRASGTH